MKSKSELIGEIVDRVNCCGCRITIPHMIASPLVVLFDGGFSSASFVQVYPPTLYIYGINGQVSVSDIIDVEKVSADEYAVSFGRDAQIFDLLVKING